MDIKKTAESIIGNLEFQDYTEYALGIEKEIWTLLSTFLRTGAKMRRTQKEYFKTRSKEVLQDSMLLEKQFDEQINQLIEQKKQFDLYTK